MISNTASDLEPETDTFTIISVIEIRKINTKDFYKETLDIGSLSTITLELLLMNIH